MMKWLLSMAFVLSTCDSTASIRYHFQKSKSMHVNFVAENNRDINFIPCWANTCCELLEDTWQTRLSLTSLTSSGYTLARAKCCRRRGHPSTSLTRHYSNDGAPCIVLPGSIFCGAPKSCTSRDRSTCMRWTRLDKAGPLMECTSHSISRHGQAT